MAAKFQREGRSLAAGGPGKASGRRWEQDEVLEGWFDFIRGGGTFQAGTGVGWPK